MAFPRQPLLFTETVPHNSYETVEGNLSSNLLRYNMADESQHYEQFNQFDNIKKWQYERDKM